MSEIVLATLNAKFIHASFGLRYLRANLAELRERSEILEFTLDQRPLEIAERILSRGPRIVGLGVYIWNVTQTHELVVLLKRIQPDLLVVLGGPEVSHETEQQEIVRQADHVVTGEADLSFRDLCRRLLAGQTGGPRIIAAPLPRMEELVLPYEEYSDEDLANRLVYVEASRGCPYECEFCLSSLDVPVRAVPLEPFLERMDALFRRGLRHFKFVDRTFNLHLPTAKRILEFFLERAEPGLFLHFEMVPDRLPEGLREIIARFPEGMMQFEVGIQTFDPVVAGHISRRQDYRRLEDNLAFLRTSTGVHVHADLIVGLPGEDEAGFARGFDRLVGMAPQEIQVGILKRLRGTPIKRHDEAFGMVYSPLPPYELLRNQLLPFETMQRLRRFARTWDLIGNSGHFKLTLPLLWEGHAAGPYAGFLEFSEWYLAREGRHHGIALVRSMERVFEFLVQQRGLAARRVAEALWDDYRRGGHRELPPFLRPALPDAKPVKGDLSVAPSGTTKRQGRHLGGA